MRHHAPMLSRRTTPWTACLLVAASLVAPAAAQEAKGVSVREAIDLATDGSATVTATVRLVGATANDVDLPLNVAAPERLTAEAAGATATATTMRSGDVRLLRVHLDQPPAADQTLRLGYAVKSFLNWDKARSPRGVYSVAYTFSNPTTTAIADYRLALSLPRGYVVAGVTSSTPRATGEEVEPPYAFATHGDRVVVELRGKAIAPGRFAAIAFNIAPQDRSPVLVLAAAVLVSLLGLYLKRDALTRASFEQKVGA